MLLRMSIVPGTYWIRTIRSLYVRYHAVTTSVVDSLFEPGSGWICIIFPDPDWDSLQSGSVFVSAECNNKLIFFSWKFQYMLSKILTIMTPNTSVADPDDDRRIRIRSSCLWFRIRIREAQKHRDPTDPDPDSQQCLWHLWGKKQCKLALLWIKVKNNFWFSNLFCNLRYRIVGFGAGLASKWKVDPDPDRHPNESGHQQWL
jgi:hypothetical protein